MGQIRFQWVRSHFCCRWAARLAVNDTEGLGTRQRLLNEFLKR